MNVELELLTNEQIYERIMRMDIPRAQHSVLIATALVKQTIVEMGQGEYAPFMKLADGLIARGIKIFLLLAGNPSRPFLSSLRTFRQSLRGLSIRICVRNHMKVVLVDGAKLYLGSANLTGAGMGHKDKNKRNFEFGFFTRDDRMIKRIGKIIEEIWERKYCGPCQVKRYCQQENERFGAALQREEKLAIMEKR